MLDLLFIELETSILNLILFGTIPFITWLMVGRKNSSFFTWVGLKKAQWWLTKNELLTLVSVLVLFLLAVSITSYLLGNINESLPEGVSMKTPIFSGLGIQAIPGILVYALFNTSLLEEVFFRGFLLKRFSKYMDFEVRNTIQALLFGLIHSIALFSIGQLILAILVTISTGLVGFFLGYITEKKFNSSILPSWAIHGAVNIIASLGITFSFF